MHYIDTKPLTMHLLRNQRVQLTKLQKNMQKKYKIKIPLSELVRQALEIGLPVITENEDKIINLIKNS